MKRPRNRRTLTLFGLALGASLALRGLDMPNLSGTWQLDKDASDDPKKVMEEARAAAPGGGGPGGGGGHGGGGHGHGGGAMGGGGSSGGSGGRHGSGSGNGGEPGAPGPDPEMLAALETLTISHAEPKLTIKDASGRERVVFTDGRVIEEERSHGGKTKVEAQWKDGRIEIVSKPETGAESHRGVFHHGRWIAPDGHDEDGRRANRHDHDPADLRRGEAHDLHGAAGLFPVEGGFVRRVARARKFS